MCALNKEVEGTSSCLLRILCIHHNIDVKIEEAYYLLSH